SLACLHSLSLTLLPRPPTSPLFPYTTLFRSHRNERREVTIPLDPVVPLGLGQEREDDGLAALPHPRMLACAVLLGGLCVEKAPQDRKSTRLNSSHGSISYAVFCLKKKHITTQ